MADEKKKPPKKTLPHPSEVHNDEDARATVLLGVEQEDAGHYAFENIQALEGRPIEYPDGRIGTPLVIFAMRFETHPNQKAQDHGLDLSSE